MAGQALLALAAAATVAVSSPTVDEVIARSIEARGGLARIRAVQTVRMSGTLSLDAMDMPMTIEFKRPASFRAEQTFQGSQAVQGYDGRQAWVIPPVGGKPQVLPAEAARQMAQQADFEGPLVDYQAKGSQAQLVGREKLEQGEAWRIKLTHEDGEVEFHLVDARTWLPVRVEATRTVQGRPVQGEVTLSGYKEFGGWKWPTTIENAAKGRPEKQTITFDKIEVNPVIDDARFRLPTAAPQTRRPTP